MSKTVLVVPALLKAHVDQYVRKDGAVVQAHDDKRQAAAPKPSSFEGHSANFDSHESALGAFDSHKQKLEKSGFQHVRSAEKNEHGEVGSLSFSKNRTSWYRHPKTGEVREVGVRAKMHKLGRSAGANLVDFGVHHKKVDEVPAARRFVSNKSKKPSFLSLMAKAHVGAYTRKDGAFVAAHDRKIEAHGVKGMKSTPWRKTFKSQKHFEDWSDKNDGDVEVHGVREVEGSGGEKPAASISASSVDVQGADRYEYANGKKPSGSGSWIFSPHKSHDFGAHGNKAGEHYFESAHGTRYADAKAQAKSWAASRGHGTVHLQT